MTSLFSIFWNIKSFPPPTPPSLRFCTLLDWSPWSAFSLPTGSTSEQAKSNCGSSPFLGTFREMCSVSEPESLGLSGGLHCRADGRGGHVGMPRAKPGPFTACATAQTCRLPTWEAQPPLESWASGSWGTKRSCEALGEPSPPPLPQPQPPQRTHNTHLLPGLG